jgi:hypothetical protein
MLSFNKNKWVWGSIIYILVILTFYYQYKTIKREKSTYTICLASSNFKYSGYKEAVDLAINETFGKSKISYYYNTVEGLYDNTANYDLVLLLLPTYEKEQFSQHIHDDNQLVLDLAFHYKDIPDDTTNDEKYSVFKGLSYKANMICLNKTIRNSKVMVFLDDTANIHFLNKNNYYCFNSRNPNVVSSVLENNINGFDTIIVNHLLNIDIINHFGELYNKNITLLLANYSALDFDSNKYNRINFISLVPSNDTTFYNDYRNFVGAHETNKTIECFLIYDYLSIILSSIVKYTPPKLNLPDLINRDFIGLSGRIKFDDRLNNVYAKPYFYNHREHKFIEY